MKFTVFKRALIFILVVLQILSGLFLFLFIKYSSEDLFLSILSSSLMFFSFVALTYQLAFGIFSHRVVIGEKGVKYIRNRKEWFINWDNIKQIIISSNKNGFYNKNCMVCFDGRGSDNSIGSSNVNKYNELFFGVQYRKQVVIEIRRYCDKPIQGIYQVEGSV